MQTDDQRSRQLLIEEVERAFADVQRGGGITLHQARVMDDYGSAGEQAEARKKDTDSRWQDIPDAWIEELGDDFGFIHDPEGFRYYVPAFMIWTLRHYGRTGGNVAEEQVAWTLGLHPTDPQILDRCRLLTHAQRQAIAHFLGAYTKFADEFSAGPAQKALDEYWCQFL